MYKIKASLIEDSAMPEGLRALHTIVSKIGYIQFQDEAEHYCRNINELSAYLGYGQPFIVESKEF